MRLYDDLDPAKGIGVLEGDSFRQGSAPFTCADCGAKFHRFTDKGWYRVEQEGRDHTPRGRNKMRGQKRVKWFCSAPCAERWFMSNGWGSWEKS